MEQRLHALRNALEVAFQFEQRVEARFRPGDLLAHTREGRLGITDGSIHGIDGGVGLGEPGA